MLAIALNSVRARIVNVSPRLIIRKDNVKMRGATARRGTVATATSLLDRERTIAMLGFNRWLVPPAALAIHLCIGMAYGFSVFWLPLSRALGVTQPVTCPSISFATELFTTTCDWRISSLGWMYTLFFVMLGSSAAIWGG